jgi:hypothetical protein
MATKTANKYDNFLLDRAEPAESVPTGQLPQARSAARPAAKAPPQLSETRAKAVAKSKDPNMKGYTLILNIDTHTDASSLLKKLRTGEDMSDLTERLLADWVSQNKPKVQ